MKFNKKSTGQTLLNHEGEKTYQLSPEMELYTAAVTTSLAPSFYETGNERLTRIQTLVAQCDPYFVAKLAIYTRQTMYLRSVPLVLVIELARHHKGDNLVSSTLSTIIQRADEITEALACYQTLNPRPGIKKVKQLSKQVQKGIAAAFLKFDEYQFAKYNRNTEITLKDALFITHPKAETPEQQQLFDKIVNDDLAVPMTWEVALSQLGQTSFENKEAKAAAVKAQWTALIDSKKLGYMALMRNLRNILQAGVDTVHIEKVASYLSSPEAVRHSKQLPFRFLTAYRSLSEIRSKHANILRKALEQAARHSTANIPGFTPATRLLIASDVSGSMYQKISPKSSIMLYDIGLVLAMLLQHSTDTMISGIFGDDWLPYSLPGENVLESVAELRKIVGKVGYSTNGYKVINYLNQQQISLDKVLIFTDMQMWNSGKGEQSIAHEWKEYKRNTAPAAKLYLFDLSGYGQAPLQVEQDDCFLIAGWSDKVFNILQAIDSGGDALEEINRVALP